MSLSVVGAGFGRTGTLSLKFALDQLGLGPCYHMKEVFVHPEHIEMWKAAADVEPDWDHLFEGYSSAVDWPASVFWSELARRYADSKIVLTRRDPGRWYESAMNTIYPASVRASPEGAPEALGKQQTMAQKLIWEGIFDGRFEDRDHAIAVFERHIERVVREIPASRLLVFEAKEGWAPLCQFLELPVPDVPYPRVNTEAEFKERVVGLAERFPR